jgi:copper transporter 1
MFAGSCIGVLLLVISLEALRRASREYDAYIMRAHLKNTTFPSVTTARVQDVSDDPGKTPSTQSTTPLLTPQTFTPNLFQQLVRAFLHMAQFAVAYIVMLLAMYYNGYIIICIFLGAFVGAFVFSWHSMALP